MRRGNGLVAVDKYIYIYIKKILEHLDIGGLSVQSRKTDKHFQWCWNCGARVLNKSYVWSVKSESYEILSYIFFENFSLYELSVEILKNWYGVLNSDVKNLIRIIF